MKKILKSQVLDGWLGTVVIRVREPIRYLLITSQVASENLALMWPICYILAISSY